MIPILHPLKQGMKHTTAINIQVANIDSHTPSTKTRIETNRKGGGSDLLSSIPILHPLKQGLKLIVRKEAVIYFLIPILHPLKQGLKQNRVFSECVDFLQFPYSIH